MARYSIRVNSNNTASIYDGVRKVTVLKSVTPQAKYNREVAELVVKLLNADDRVTPA